MHLATVKAEVILARPASGQRLAVGDDNRELARHTRTDNDVVHSSQSQAKQSFLVLRIEIRAEFSNLTAQNYGVAARIWARHPRDVVLLDSRGEIRRCTAPAVDVTADAKFYAVFAGIFLKTNLARVKSSSENDFSTRFVVRREILLGMNEQCSVFCSRIREFQKLDVTEVSGLNVQSKQKRYIQ